MTDRFDAEGTRPGLTSISAKEKTLNMKCRSPRGCNSMEAIEVKLDGPSHHGQRLYRCAKCGHTMSLSLGGHFDI